MEKTVLEFVEKDICVAVEDYWIFPLHNTPPLWVLISRRKRGYIKIYVFKPRYHDFAAPYSSRSSFSVPVRLRPHTKQLTVDRIQVCYKQQWVR